MDIMDDDFLLALELQEQMDRESWQPSQPPTKPNSNLSIVDESWEYIDPNPDIRQLFLQFNEEFFWGRLAGIEVKWSPRMTLCAGLCVYERRGGLCSVRLSQPLLKLRPRKDLVETLLHEMIHAYLFVTDNNKDHDGHGPEFHKHMHRINNATGTKISVYHNFHDEVDHFRQHWWRCNGPCQNRKPFFGYVKRAMNRAPSERDPWWRDHKNSCNGTFVKIKEPEGYGKKKAKEKSEKIDKNGKSGEKNTSGKADIRSFFDKGQGQKKVIINGVLTDKKPTKPTSTVSSSSEKSRGDNSLKSGKSSSLVSPLKTKIDNSSNSPQKGKQRISVNAINTSGKISDKELQRQQKLAELMLSDSDDDDLIFCDDPVNAKTVTSKGENVSPLEQINWQQSIEHSLEETYPSYDMSFNANDKKMQSIPFNISNSSGCEQTPQSPREKSDIEVISNTQSGVNNVALHVRNIWANKQFGPSLKPLDPKADGLNLFPNKLKSSIEQSDAFHKGHLLDGGNNIFVGKKSNKRLSAEDTNVSRKRLKNDSDHEPRFDDMLRTQQNENCVPNLANCPVCAKSVPSLQINEHLDQCLGMC